MPNSAGALDFPVLIGDIGGTNARFALVETARSRTVALPSVRTADYPSLDDAVAASIAATTMPPPRSAILAVAAPVDGDEIPLTNCPWVVRPGRLADAFDLSSVTLLNDFEAQAMAAVALGPANLVQIGGGQGDPEASRVVLGPGTGLGVAGLVRARGAWVPVPGEGGHVDIGPRTQRDRQVFARLETIEGRISAEQMLCGRGLVNIYRAIAAADGNPALLADPAAITAAGLAGTDPIAEETVSIFVTCLGRLAGDLALIFMARGGVFLTGGIAQKIVPALADGRFRAAFEDKAPHSALVASMPVSVITHPLAAIEGLAAHARDPGLFAIETRDRRWPRPAA